MKGWLYKTQLKRGLAKAQQRGPAPPTKLAATRTPTTSPNSFVPIRLAQSDSEPANCLAIAVMLGSVRRAAVEQGFDPETLRQVIVALEAGSR
jgi:hypothetical protein